MVNLEDFDRNVLKVRISERTKCRPLPIGYLQTGAKLLAKLCHSMLAQRLKIMHLNQSWLLLRERRIEMLGIVAAFGRILKIEHKFAVRMNKRLRNRLAGATIYFLEESKTFLKREIKKKNQFKSADQGQAREAAWLETSLGFIINNNWWGHSMSGPLI